jgi:NTP pyrophosphatase (non-canonical NTP hydrolase)
MITQDDIDAFLDMAQDEIKDFHIFPDATPQEMVTQFVDHMGQPMDKEYKLGSDLEDFRFALMREEFYEVVDETEPHNRLKELADLLYVIYGYAVTFGWDLDEAFRRVHESNMSKLGDDGKPIKDNNGKVMKGPNYKRPNLKDLV